MPCGAVAPASVRPSQRTTTGPRGRRRRARGSAADVRPKDSRSPAPPGQLAQAESQRAECDRSVSAGAPGAGRREVLLRGRPADRRALELQLLGPQERQAGCGEQRGDDDDAGAAAGTTADCTAADCVNAGRPRLPGDGPSRASLRMRPGASGRRGRGRSRCCRAAPSRAARVNCEPIRMPGIEPIRSVPTWRSAGGTRNIAADCGRDRDDGAVEKVGADDARVESGKSGKSAMPKNTPAPTEVNPKA